MLKLDDRDLEILKVLADEARISKADLAKRINLSPSPCWKRLERLEKAGIIQGYHADICLRKLTSHVTVFVTLELEHHRAEYFQKFERTIAGFEEITACWALGGGLDYLMEIVAPDINAYQRLIDKLLDMNLGIVRYFTYVVTKAVKPRTAFPMSGFLTQLIEDETSENPDE